MGRRQYQEYIREGWEGSNEPYGYQYSFSTTTFLNDLANLTIDARLSWSTPKCSKCLKGYGLSQDQTSCTPCPQGCLLCLYATLCLATTNEQVLALSSSSDLLGCSNFIGPNDECVMSCPRSTKPVLNDTWKKIRCEPWEGEGKGESGYLRVDGSTYIVSEGKYIHRFVFDSPLSNRAARLLAQTGWNIDPTGNSVTFESSRPVQILNLTGSIG